MVVFDVPYSLYAIFFIISRSFYLIYCNQRGFTPKTIYSLTHQYSRLRDEIAAITDEIIFKVD